MSVVPTRMVHIGPGLRIFDSTKFQHGVDILLTVLWRLDPACCTQALQRLASPEGSKQVKVNDKPWLTLGHIIESHLKQAVLQFGDICGINLSATAQLTIVRDLRLGAVVLCVYTMLEKILRRPTADINTVRETCFSQDRIELLLDMAELAGQALRHGMESQFSLQATGLKEREPALWQEHVAETYNSAQITSLFEWHTLIASATAATLAEKIQWSRFNEESVALPLEWQEDATLQALMTVLLYELAVHLNTGVCVRSLMSEALEEMQLFLQGQQDTLEAEAAAAFPDEEPPPTEPSPTPPQQKKPTLTVVK